MPSLFAGEPGIGIKSKGDDLYGSSNSRTVNRIQNTLSVVNANHIAISSESMSISSSPASEAGVMRRKFQWNSTRRTVVRSSSQSRLAAMAKVIWDHEYCGGFVSYKQGYDGE